jgi:protein-tyrosine phosphatase
MEYYRLSGFNVIHIPYLDHQTPLLSDKCKEEILKAFNYSEKPALIHCSAGIGRTGEAVEYIKGKS